MAKHSKLFCTGLFLFILIGTSHPLLSQSSLTYPGTEEGVKFKSADNSMSLNFSMRMQNRFEMSSENSENFSPKQAQFLVRRMRLKSDGYMVNPRLRYKLELAFTRNDIGGLPNNLASIILDANIQYEALPKFVLTFGQFKLPGNRQRVISSMNLQMVDRSLANSAFNLDRDVGFMASYTKQLGQAQLQYFGVISNGEGRNFLSSGVDINREEFNLAFTQRLEFLPFGSFSEKGAYFEGDLLREEKPKLSVAAGYYHNDDALRAQGQLGSSLYETRDINSFFSDFIFKYRGFSIMGEYMLMESNENPVTSDIANQQRAVRSGEGYMIQGGYLWPSMWEVSGRYGEILPSEQVLDFQQAEKEVLLGLSRYIRGHRIKVQSDIGYLVDNSAAEGFEDYWRWRFQMELGF